MAHSRPHSTRGSAVWSHRRFSISSCGRWWALSPQLRNKRRNMDQVSARYRLGVDVGGTHTDLVLLDTKSGALLVEKVVSTPKNPALGVMNGVARFIARGVQPPEIGFFGHGT